MDINLLKAHLGDDLFAQVQERLGDLEGFAVIATNDGTWLPKARLDDEIGKRNSLKETIKTLTKQLQEAEEKATASSGLTTQLEQAQQTIAEREATIAALKRSSKVHAALVKAHAKNPDIVEKLLDGQKIGEDDKGNLTGIDDQIKALKEENAYLFSDGEGTSGKGGFFGGSKDQKAQPNTSNDEVNQAIRSAFGRS